MKRPDTFTITTFWLDWLFFPIVLGAAWLTLRWALADTSQASNLGTWGVMPAWVVSISLFVTAAGWVIIGLGMLIKEEYWEFRMISSGLIIWTLCCLIGAGLILLGFLRGNSGFGVAGLLDLIGLVLMSFPTPDCRPSGSSSREVRAAGSLCGSRSTCRRPTGSWTNCSCSRAHPGRFGAFRPS